MLKFLCCCLLLLGSFGSFAQSTEQQFIKLAHIGEQGKPILDLYLTPQEPAINPEQGITSQFIFKNVCLLSASEFAALLRYTEAYCAANKPDSRNAKYGTFELTLGPYAAARRQVYTRSKSLAYMQGAIDVLQQQATDPDQNEALRRLAATAHRLRNAAN